VRIKLYRSWPRDEGSDLEETITRKRFIRLGTALGVGAASASVLAACGGAESGGGSGGGSGSGGESGGGGSQGGASGNGGGGSNGTQRAGSEAIARTSEVSPGSAVKFEESGSPAVLVHLDSGEFVAYSAICTHQRCEVAYQNGQLACPCHGSIFDPANGAAVVSGPAQRPLPEVPVEVQGGEVFRA
jgi:nitrite reductase/ring-hydroxylating ferredoxin subunit